MPNLSAKSNNTTDATKREYYSKALSARQLLEAAQREVKTLNGQYRAVLKDAKTAGVTTDALTFALKARNIDPDELFAQQRDRIRMLALSGVMPTIQADLFKAVGSEAAPSGPEAAHNAAERSYDDGFFRGNAGDNRSLNNHPPGSEPWEAWDRGWIAGQAQIVNNRSSAVPRIPRKGKQGDNGALV